MSGLLWRYYLEDDVDTFRQLLEEAAVANRAHAGQRGAGNPGAQQGQAGGFAFTVGSPVSPSASYDSRKATAGGVRGRAETQKISFHDVTLTRADVNRKDGKGMTLLHYAATATGDNALAFALALLAHPLIELYAQDLENGWTALHRAFYFGNVTVARAVLEREAQDAIGQGSGGIVASGGFSLIKIKDREGNSPYDLLTTTIKDRTLQHRDLGARYGFLTGRDDEEEEEMEPTTNENDEDGLRKATVKPLVDVEGDEVLTFGSNKNITLGLGNQDDRQYPERVVLRKPDHLYKRFHKEHIEQHAAESDVVCPPYAEKIRAKLRQPRSPAELPAVVRFKYEKIQDVQMSRFHTAFLTNDPVSNLYLCGHGLGGRLGTGDQKTQFHPVCIESFGSNRKKINAIALGQDHSLAVTDQGEVFCWGSNAFGQLGLGLPKISLNADDNIELLPKQIFGPLKRELVVGVAASRIHSVAHTSTALFTWGKNEGQLGIVDAHAGSLEIQPIPRRVAASRFSCTIQSVSAIDRATICLLENQEVHVFANYGIVKVVFPLDGFTSSFLKKSFLTTRYDDTPNRIVKVTGGGDTFCALSSAGEIYSVTVDQRLDPGSSTTMSTTNPNKIKAALSAPSRVWSLKKGHMTAKDVGVDQDGSIILSTNAGSVWRRVRRPGSAAARGTMSSDKKSKEFKFSRVPGLTRVVAVRASGSGAYCAMRSECDVTRTQILPASKSLWRDTYALLPFKNLIEDEDSGIASPVERSTEAGSSIHQQTSKPNALQRLIARLGESKDLERDIERVIRTAPNKCSENYDMLICTTISEVKIPAHRFMLAGRSRLFRQLLSEGRENTGWQGDLCTIGIDDEGNTLLTFHGLDFLTIVEFVMYIYADVFVGFWLLSRYAPQLAYRYRQVRTELMKVASRFELRNLESAARRMSPTADLSLDKDFELAVMEPSFFQDGNALIELADGEALIHTDLVSRRCPFFEGLFQGRAGGRWLAERRDQLSGPDEAIGIDMTHVELSVFQIVLRHIYADTGVELFDDIVTKDLDQFLDIVLDVLSVANELMLDRLSQICQMMLGRYVNARNACQLLNAVSPSAVTEFKDAGLEYLCLNLEAMLSSRLLDELDEDLLRELDAVVRDNQLASLPFAKSGRAEALLHERYPQLAMQLDRARQAKLDFINFQTKFAESGGAFGTSLDATFDDELPSAPSRPKARTRPSATATAPQTPYMKAVAPSPNLPSSVRSVGVGQPPSSAIASQRLTPRDIGSPSPGVSPAGPQPETMQSPSDYAFGLLPPPAEGDVPGASLRAASQLEPPSPSTPSAAQPSTRPWGANPLPSTKLTIKEIMEQAATRTSNISLGLASQGQSSDGQTTGTSKLRASQKERKEQQQAQQRDGSTTPQGSSNAMWQTVGARAQSSGKGVAVDAKIQPPRPTLSRTPSNTPQLTMRQTVANAPATTKQKEPAAVTSKPPATPAAPQRSASSTQMQTPRPSLTPNTPSTSSATSSAKPIEIQSIRHTPRSPTHDPSVSPTSHLYHQSMTDIFSQQAAEKLERKEATIAKRSLAEIQQEQEFLSWWDQESKRVMEEEDKAARAAEKDKAREKVRGGRGRGGGGSAGGERRRSAGGRGRGGRGDAGSGNGRGGRGGKGKEFVSVPAPAEKEKRLTSPVQENADASGAS